MTLWQELSDSLGTEWVAAAVYRLLVVSIARLPLMRSGEDALTVIRPELAVALMIAKHLP